MKVKSVLICAAAAAALTLGAKELYPAGDFEKKSYSPMSISNLVSKDRKRVTAPKGTVTAVVQSQKVFNGKNALLLTAGKGGMHDLNIRNLPVKAGKKYTFSMRYFVEEGIENFYLGCRLNMVRKGKKPVNRFPRGKAAAGEWMTLKTTFYPHADTEKMNLTVWVGKGPYKVYIDDIKITEVAETKVEESDSNTALILQNEDVTVWRQANYRRIDAQKVPAGLKKSARVTLECTANEMEPFQLAVFPKKELKDLSLQISDFKGENGTISKNLQSYGIVRYAKLNNPNNPTLKGEIADPLTDEKVTDAPANKNTIFFVRLFAPKGTAAGTYRSDLELKSGDKVLCKLPLTLKVRNFELPDTPAIRTLFYAHPGTAKKSYKDQRSVKEISEDMSMILKNHRITGSQCIMPPVPKYEIKGDTLTITDWSKFDAQVKYMYEKHGVRDFTLPVLRMFGYTSGWKRGKIKVFGVDLFTERARKLSADFARQIHEHWMKTMPEDALYYSYVYDEPPPKVYDELNKFTGYVKKAAPDFRFFITHYMDPLVKNISVHCVPFGYAYVNPELEKGLEIWYYNWPQPLAHFNYIQNRIYAWQIYANGGRGGLKWQVAHTTANNNPWNALDKTYLDGDATTVYPAITPGGKMVASLRLAQIRESVDDGDYLKLLEKEVEKSFPNEGRKYVYNLIRELLPSLPFGYTNDAELLYNMRSRLADAIENFNLDPVVLVTSEPLNNSSVELPEIKFTIRGKNGASVKLNGKNVGVITGDLCKFTYTLPRLGKNFVKIKVTSNGKSKVYNYVYTLLQDANLKKLAALVKTMQQLKLDHSEADELFKSVEKSPYTAEMRDTCSRLTAEYAQKIMASKIARLVNGKNTAVNALNDQAKAMFKLGLYNRTDYYLALAEEFGKYMLPKSSAMKIEPVMIHGNFGFKISNGIIEFVLLEMGGRVVSFKVDGVETFNPGNLDRSLPVAVRAGRQYNKFTIRTIPFLGGYEDAGEYVLPESAVDWDIAVKEISNKRIALECSILMQNKKFKISRVMVCEAGSPELKINYTISNVFPPEFKSDDPTHYHLDWRGRLMPQIGKSAQGDKLNIPTDVELPAVLFDNAKPIFYEKRSVRLKEQFMSITDQAEKTGLAWQIDPQINYAYIWFDSQRKKGSNGVYTLEIFRSFRGNVHGAKANTPFYIEPGKSVKFNVTLKGVKL